MSATYIIIMLIAAVTMLLIMVLRFKISAFIALLVTSILVGILAGMPLSSIIETIQKGMGSTLGFVATVVGLGAIFGQLLESSGGAEALAHSLINKFGKDKATWAMVITGFIVAIPVFIDVGIIILIPLVYALSRDTKRSLLYYGIPLLAGLAVTHSFLPPTPGPIAVAEIIGADFGWLIIFGLILGFPTAILAGPLYGRYISKKIFIAPPESFQKLSDDQQQKAELPSFRLVASIIALPLILILISAFTSMGIKLEMLSQSTFTDVVVFIGHPFIALIIATFLAIWFLCRRKGMSRQTILDLSTKAMGPAGIIILVTGAGGVLKQVLVDSGIGEILANYFASSAMPPILLAWILAAVVRVTQGSTTVAMITAAGIIAPILPVFHLNAPETALIAIAIASGATLLSHINDSAFWLVNKYFGMDVKQTLRSWTVMVSIISFCGLGLALLASLFV